MSVDIVYAGIKSPITGINSMALIAAAFLLLVIEYNKLFTKTSAISPITGNAKIGAPAMSSTSAATEIPSAVTALNSKGV